MILNAAIQRRDEVVETDKVQQVFPILGDRLFDPFEIRLHVNEHRSEILGRSRFGHLGDVEELDLRCPGVHSHFVDHEQDFRRFVAYKSQVAELFAHQVVEQFTRDDEH